MCIFTLFLISFRCRNCIFSVVISLSKCSLRHTHTQKWLMLFMHSDTQLNTAILSSWTAISTSLLLSETFVRRTYDDDNKTKPHLPSLTANCWRCRHRRRHHRKTICILHTSTCFDDDLEAFGYKILCFSAPLHSTRSTPESPSIAMSSPFICLLSSRSQLLDAVMAFTKSSKQYSLDEMLRALSVDW